MKVTWCFEGWGKCAIGIYLDLDSNYYSTDDGDYILHGITILWWSAVIYHKSKKKSPWIRV